MSSATPRPVLADAAVRREALDPAHSFLVQAPAGSGKTELLMQRFLACLATAEQPESVLAITFTRKAAAEMRGRILRTLERARQLGEGELRGVAEHERQSLALARAALCHAELLGWRLLEQPARLQVRTLDSFCEAIAQRAPFKGLLGGAAEVTEDATPLYERAAQGVLEHLGEEGSVADAVAALLEHLDNDVAKARELLAAMLAGRDQWLPRLGRSDQLDAAQLQRLRGELEGSLAEAVGEELTAVRALLRESIDGDEERELFALMRYAAENLSSRGEGASVDAIAASAGESHPLIGIRAWPAADAAELERWRAVATFFLTTDDSFRKKVDRRNGFPPETQEDKAVKQRAVEQLARLAANTNADELTAALARIRLLPQPRYTEAQWVFMRALLQLLPLAAAHLALVFADEATIDFAEYTQRALEAIGAEGDPTELGLQLGYRIRHVLVDEFQDTSQVQVELLSRLLRTWEGDEGCSIFCVGDPMQSIYSFRNADVAIYQQSLVEGIGGRALLFRQLARNFRSQSRLVEWFNRIFPFMLFEENEATNAVCYAAAEPTQPALEGAEVEIAAFAKGDREGEARHLAECIRRELERPVPEGEKPASIAVLVRSRSHLPQLFEAMREAGVRYRAVKTDPLGGRPLVRDLEALRLALCHAADRTAWLAVLRAPWCGLRLADLLALCRNDSSSTVMELLQARGAGLSAEAQRALARCLPVLQAAVAQRARTPLRLLVESTWLQLQGPACLGAEQAQGLRDAAAYFALLDQQSEAGEIRNPAHFAGKLKQLHAPADAASDIRVEVMPIHQAKGLEWDVVFLPALERTSRQDEKRLLYWRLRKPSLLLGPIEARGATRGKEATIESYLRELAAGCAREELKRLFYVAATRARRRLYLSAAVAEGSTPRKGTFLQLLWPVEELRPAFTPPAGGEAAEPAPEPPRAELLLRRLPVEHKAVAAPEPLPWSYERRPGTEIQHTFDWAGEMARLVGQVTHSYLERVAIDGVQHWNAARVDAARPRIAAQLQRLGAEPGKVAAAAGRVAEALRRTLADERGRWLLAAREEHACELALSAEMDGRLEHIRVDRTFVEDGVRWLVDYKTSEHEGSGLERWLGEQVGKYRPDMERYERVLRTFDARRVRCALYFPLLGVFREVDIERSESVGRG